MKCDKCGSYTNILDSRKPTETNVVTRTRVCRRCPNRMYTIELDREALKNIKSSFQQLNDLLTK
jgi:transcriptional regulator NrdR family protein